MKGIAPSLTLTQIPDKLSKIRPHRNPPFPHRILTTHNYGLQITNNLYVPTMDFITPSDKPRDEVPFVPTINYLDDNRVRIELYTKEGGTFLGMLYYEKAKNGFSKKPVGLKKMACVDAKIETLFNLFPHIEPKDVLDYCQSLLDGGDKDTTQI